MFHGRRARFSAGIYAAGWSYLGDIGGSRWFPAGEIDFEAFSNSPVALNLTLGYGTIGTKQNFRSEIAIAEITGNYRWFRETPSTPYIRFGLGSMMEIKNNLDDGTVPFENYYPYIMGEFGYEFYLKDKLS